MNRLIFTLFFIVAFGIVTAQNKNQEVIQVILLAGQSNMAGAGNYTALDATIKQRVVQVADRVMISNSGKTPTPLSFYLSKGHKEKYGFEEAFGPELM
ncbi:sialate O-acetylesterase, partial [Flavobacterium sp.]|uniref:sialate O-acetylesterase n=1 Tax=Flavobacterium sp. TaxID=239 RepID=UPI003C5A34AD